MSRNNEYKSAGGSFSKPSDALSSIEQSLEEVKKTENEEREAPIKKRGFRTVISELQNELSSCIDVLMKSWNELKLDPLYIQSIENVSPKQYARNIKFIHPEYEHVWLTEGKGANIAEELIPFIDYGIVYDYKKNKISILNLILDTKLNLPDFKTSREAAQVDLEILKKDAQRVELVCKNGESAHQKISETLTKYCKDHEIELEMEQDLIPHMESPEERAQRLQKEEEDARKAALEAKMRAAELEREAKRKAAEMEREAKRKAEEEEREAKLKAEKEEREAKLKAEKEEREAKLKAEEKQREAKLKAQEEERRKKAEEVIAARKARAAKEAALVAAQRPSSLPVGRSMPPPPPPSGLVRPNGLVRPSGLVRSTVPPAPPPAKRQ